MIIKHQTKGMVLMADIFLIYGADVKAMTIGLLKRSQITCPQGAEITLKPNLVVPRPASYGSTTHPEVAEGIIEYLFEHGHRNIRIAEGSWVGDSTTAAFKTCGYEALAKRYGISLFDTKKDKPATVSTEAGNIAFCESILKSDILINLPVLKGHCQTRLSCALKNLKGCIPDSEKRRFHRMGLHKPIAAVASVLKPALTIVDGVCGDLDFEEGGNPVNAWRMLLCTDPVQADAFACSLMGLETADVPYIRLAAEYGAGSLSPSNIIPINEPLIVNMPKSTHKVASLEKYIVQDSACSACYANTIYALAHEANPKQKLYIGQGFRGKTPDGIGVGKCCSGAPVHIPGCPPDTAQIIKALRQN